MAKSEAIADSNGLMSSVSQLIAVLRNVAPTDSPRVMAQQVQEVGSKLYQGWLRSNLWRTVLPILRIHGCHMALAK